MVVDDVVVHRGPLHRGRQAGSGVQLPGGVAGLTLSQAGVQHRDRDPQPDHRDLGARHGSNYLAEQAAIFQDRHRISRPAPAWRKFDRMHARLRWLTRSFQGSPSGSGPAPCDHGQVDQRVRDARLAQPPRRLACHGRLARTDGSAEQQDRHPRCHGRMITQLVLPSTQQLHPSVELVQSPCKLAEGIGDLPRRRVSVGDRRPR